jgi:hypothetical protein
MTVYDLPHIANIEEMSNGIYRVTTEQGYYIGVCVEEDYYIWKTVTFIYPSDDLAAIQILAEADLPEDAEICADTTKPEVM